MKHAAYPMALLGVVFSFAVSYAAPLDSTQVVAPAYGSGLKLVVSFQPLDGHDGTYAIIRSAQKADGPWTLVKAGLASKKTKPKVHTVI